MKGRSGEPAWTKIRRGGGFKEHSYRQSKTGATHKPNYGEGGEEPLDHCDPCEPPSPHGKSRPFQSQEWHKPDRDLSISRSLL